MRPEIDPPPGDAEEQWLSLEDRLYYARLRHERRGRLVRILALWLMLVGLVAALLAFGWWGMPALWTALHGGWL